MDGENNGTPFFFNGLFGGETPLFLVQHPAYILQVNGSAPLGSKSFRSLQKGNDQRTGFASVKHIPQMVVQNGDESHEVPYWTPKPLKHEGFSAPANMGHNP